MPIEVSQLNYYPVKSCAGISLSKAQICTRGIEHDREWAVWDVHSRTVLTQRQAAKLCLIKASVQNSGAAVALQLNVEAMSPLEIPVVDSEEVETTFPWGPVCRGLDQGDAAAKWLSSYLERECRLLHFSPSFVRQVDQQVAKRPTDQTGFADDCAFLLLSDESLRELNSQLVEPLPTNRFRPNIVVRGATSYAEDDWKVIRIGDVVFDVLQKCGRCVITTVNQADASKGVEPLHTLAKHRKFGNKLMFGVHLAHRANGSIALHDEVEVLE